MLPYQMIGGGTFTVSVSGGVAAATNVELVGQFPPDFIIARSITGWGEASDAQSIQWWWERSMGNGAARGILQSSDATNPALTSRILPAAGGTSDAISVFDTSNPPTYAALVANTNGMTPAIDRTTWVVNMNTGGTGTLAVGDWVRVLNPVGMLQATGIVAQVTAVTAGTNITLGYVASAVTAGANFTANASSASILKFIPNFFYPRKSQVIHVTQAAQAVVYFAQPHTFTAGEMVDFNIPSTYGMTQLSFLTKGSGPARVLSVTNSATVSSITLDLDTTGFTAFSYPTSANSVGAASPPFCFPAGSGVVPLSGSASVPQQPPGTNLQDSFDNRNVRYIRFGAGLFNVSSFVSDNGDTWSWQAFKYDDYRAGNLTLA